MERRSEGGGHTYMPPNLFRAPYLHYSPGPLGGSLMMMICLPPQVSPPPNTAADMARNSERIPTYPSSARPTLYSATYPNAAGLALTAGAMPNRAMSPSCASDKTRPSEFGPQTKGSWITSAPYEAQSLNKEKNTVNYSYLACCMNACPLNMYESLSYTGFTRRNTLFIFAWLCPRNT